jgi:hypothetical protein
MQFTTYVYLTLLMVGLLTVLAYAGEDKFRALETFVGLSGGAKDNWMPTASGRNAEGIPVGASATLEGAPVKMVNTEKLVVSERLMPMGAEEANMAWGKLTSERCFRSDMAEELKKTRNFLQRTNNYQHSHPDSCSAPNHEFIGTFYRPHEGIGAVPASGLPYPRGATDVLPC